MDLWFLCPDNWLGYQVGRRSLGVKLLSSFAQRNGLCVCRLGWLLLPLFSWTDPVNERRGDAACNRLGLLEFSRWLNIVGLLVSSYHAVCEQGKYRIASPDIAHHQSSKFEGLKYLSAPNSFPPVLVFDPRSVFQMMYSRFSSPSSRLISRSARRTLRCSSLARLPKCIVLFSHIVRRSAPGEWSPSCFSDQSFSSSSLVTTFARLSELLSFGLQRFPWFFKGFVLQDTVTFSHLSQVAVKTSLERS